MSYTLASYLLYLVITVPITVWVARTLFRNGRVFLLDVFHGRDDLANAVNALLVVGFYLLNLGFVTLYLASGGEVHSATGVLQSLSSKVGIVLLVLAVVHLGNVWVFSRWRRRSLVDRSARAPLPPSGHTSIMGPGFPPPTGAPVAPPA